MTIGEPHVQSSGGIEAVLHHLDIPLLRPFTTATGRVEERSVGLVSISRSRVSGWGEASPFPGQDEPFAQVLDAARSGFITPTLAAAIDEAKHDLVARETLRSLTSELGPTRVSVPISVAVGIGDDGLETASDAGRSGVSQFKVKIAPGRTDHVAEIRRLFPDVTIGLDANGSFDTRSIGEILALGALDIAFVEQPTIHPGNEAVQIVADAGFTVFIDESVRSESSAGRALAEPGVAGVVVKPGRLGWRSSVEVVRMARAADKLWRSSGLFETAVGRAFTLALAAADDAFVSDIAPASQFFAYDVAQQPVVDGCVVVPSGPGTGLDVDPDLVRRRAVEVIPLSESVVQGLG
jgi:L-alanine-DL-glutamate epimerase-like enolase superfamily enzyme